MPARTRSRSRCRFAGASTPRAAPRCCLRSEAALVDPAVARGLRQVVFLTDGSLSNEAEMMEEIARNRGRSTVFMVGVGSAPNTYLMRRMAEAGRGTFTHIGVAGEAAERMQDLLDRLTAPVAKDLEVTVDGAQLELAPRDLPDLYAGEPLMLLGRGKDLAGLRSRSAGRSTASPGASRCVSPMRTRATRSPNSGPAVAFPKSRRSVGRASWTTRWPMLRLRKSAWAFTSSRRAPASWQWTRPHRGPEGARLTREELPLLLPAGWEFDALFGDQIASEPQQDPDSESRQDAALELPAGRDGLRRPHRAGSRADRLRAGHLRAAAAARAGARGAGLA